MACHGWDVMGITFAVMSALLPLTLLFNPHRILLPQRSKRRSQSALLPVLEQRTLVGKLEAMLGLLLDALAACRASAQRHPKAAACAALGVCTTAGLVCLAC